MIFGQKSVKFFVGFLENLRHQKDVLKLTDLQREFKAHGLLSVNKT